MQGQSFPIAIEQLLTRFVPSLELPRINQAAFSDLLNQLERDENHEQVLRDGIRLLHEVATAANLTTSPLEVDFVVNARSIQPGSLQTSRERPDAARQVSPSSPPSWRDFCVPIEAKKAGLGWQETELQLLRYMELLAQELGGAPEVLGLLFDRSRLRLIYTNPSASYVSVFVSLSDLLTVARVVALVYSFRPLPPSCSGYFSPSLDPFGDIRAFSTRGIAQTVGITRSLLGARTIAWAGSQGNPASIVKLSWLRPGQAFKEAAILKHLEAQGMLWGVPTVLDNQYGVVVVNASQDHDDPVWQATKTWCPNPPDGRRRAHERFLTVLVTSDHGHRALNTLSLRPASFTVRHWIWFLSALVDATLVVWHAWKLARSHHRDVSSGNLAVIPFRRFKRQIEGQILAEARQEYGSDEDALRIPDRVPLSVLIDWGQSRRHLDVAAAATGSTRAEEGDMISDALSGTLPFCSLDLLESYDTIKAAEDAILRTRPSDFKLHTLQKAKDEAKRHVPLHDVESLLYILLWICGGGENSYELKKWKRQANNKAFAIGRQWFVLLGDVFERWESLSIHPILIRLAIDLKTTICGRNKLGSDPAAAQTPELEAQITDDTGRRCAEFVGHLRLAIKTIAAFPEDEVRPGGPQKEISGDSEAAASDVRSGSRNRGDGEVEGRREDDEGSSEEDERPASTELVGGIGGGAARVSGSDDRADHSSGEAQGTPSRHRTSEASQSSPRKRARAV